MRISGFLASIELIENKNKMVKLDNIEKAISQDIKKMLLAAKKVNDYSIGYQGTPLFVENENGEAEWFYDEEKDSIQIYMEYFIYKYRVIVEYVVRILDEVIYMDENAYKKNNSKKHIGEFERTNVKLEFIRKLILKYCSEQIDLEWFDEVRKVRTEPLPAKAGRFGELLKQPKGSAPQLLLFILLFSNFKVVRVTSLLQILVLDILFDYFIRHVSATCHKISSRP